MEIAFIFVERVVLIDVLGSVRGGERVPFDTVVAFVALKHTKTLLVVVISSEEMIIVTGRVVERGERIGLHTLYCRRAEFAAQFLKIIRI